MFIYYIYMFIYYIYNVYILYICVYDYVIMIEAEVFGIDIHF